MASTGSLLSGPHRAIRSSGKPHSCAECREQIRPLYIIYSRFLMRTRTSETTMRSRVPVRELQEKKRGCPLSQRYVVFPLSRASPYRPFRFLAASSTVRKDSACEALRSRRTFLDSLRKTRSSSAKQLPSSPIDVDSSKMPYENFKQNIPPKPTHFSILTS